MALFTPVWENRRGLVGHWRYHGNVSALGTWYDISGNGNNTTLASGAFVDNNGINFTSDSDYGQTPIVGDIFSGSYTFLAWIYNDTAGDRGVLFGNFLSSTASDNVSFEIYSTNALRIYYKGALASSGVDFTGTSGSVPSQEWVLAGFVRDKDNSKVKLYINAELDAENSTVWGDMSPTRAMRFGNDYRLQSTAFKGKEDNCMLYNRALSPQEVNQIYHSTRGR